MSQSKELFALFSLRVGKRLDFDVDCTPWLIGTARITGFVPDPADWGPVTYEPPIIAADGKSVKFFAAASSDATLTGFYRVGVDLADDQGRTDREWFQMKVE
jgi:hypothetical protein